MKKKSTPDKTKRAIQKTYKKYTPILQGMQETTHKYKALNHMLTHGSITTMEAFSRYKMTRLPAVIWELRNEPFNIPITTDKITKKVAGTLITYAKYSVEC